MRDDMNRLEKRLRADMATKEDLRNLEQSLRKDMATKDDMAKLEHSLHLQMGVLHTNSCSLEGKFTDLSKDVQDLRGKMVEQERNLLAKMENMQSEIIGALRDEMSLLDDRITPLEQALGRH